jgi:hypothetical protein
VALSLVQRGSRSSATGAGKEGCHGGCPNGHANPEGQRYCGECGVRIQTAASSKSGIPTSSTSWPPNASVPPAWYPDPEGSAQQRYWDGQQWSDHLSPPPPQATNMAFPEEVQPTGIGDDRTGLSPSPTSHPAVTPSGRPPAATTVLRFVLQPSTTFANSSVNWEAM